MDHISLALDQRPRWIVQIPTKPEKSPTNPDNCIKCLEVLVFHPQGGRFQLAPFPAGPWPPRGPWGNPCLFQEICNLWSLCLFATGENRGGRALWTRLLFSIFFPCFILTRLNFNWTWCLAHKSRHTATCLERNDICPIWPANSRKAANNDQWPPSGSFCNFPHKKSSWWIQPCPKEIAQRCTN